MKDKPILKFILSCGISAILACLIIVSPIFFTYLDDGKDAYIPGSNKSELSTKNAKAQGINKQKEDIAVFSSDSCVKKTYYVSHDNVKMYGNINEVSSPITMLKKNDELVCDKEQNGYLYCETNHIDSKGKLINGWVKKDSDDLSGIIFEKPKFLVDVNLSKQTVNLYRNSILINKNKIRCSSGINGDNQTETPLGLFTVKDKFKNLTSQKYGENVKYAVKFLGNYLIHSVPIDEVKTNGKIQAVANEKAESELGKPASHGCIRLSLEDAEMVYNDVNIGDVVYIHY